MPPGGVVEADQQNGFILLLRDLVGGGVHRQVAAEAAVVGQGNFLPVVTDMIGGAGIAEIQRPEGRGRIAEAKLRLQFRSAGACDIVESGIVFAEVADLETGAEAAVAVEVFERGGEAIAAAFGAGADGEIDVAEVLPAHRGTRREAEKVLACLGGKTEREPVPPAVAVKTGKDRVSVLVALNAEQLPQRSDVVAELVRPPDKNVFGQVERLAYPPFLVESVADDDLDFTGTFVAGDVLQHERSGWQLLFFQKHAVDIDLRHRWGCRSAAELHRRVIDVVGVDVEVAGITGAADQDLAAERPGEDGVVAGGEATQFCPVVADRPAQQADIARIGLRVGIDAVGHKKGFTVA